MNVTIIGTGLIGGSLAIALRESGFATKINGVENNRQHAEVALSLGLVDDILPLEDAIKNSQFIIAAIPVNELSELIPSILDKINDKQTVVDMGSTKAGICEAVKNHPKRKRFVASHPIAGTENTGPSAAIPDLFQNKISIICEKSQSAADAVELVKTMYEKLKMKLIYMGAKEHDLHVAYVSHLSHISSFTLGLTVLDIEKSEANIFNLAGSGFASTVRLAKSSPEMWAPIFEQNSEYVSEALGSYIEHLQKFKEMIDNKETGKLHEQMKRANEIRRILDGMVKKLK